MGGELDRFQIVLRSCKPLPPDGYSVLLEIRRRPADAPADAREGSPAAGARDLAEEPQPCH
jgi:hypothetical protein